MAPSSGGGLGLEWGHPSKGSEKPLKMWLSIVFLVIMYMTASSSGRSWHASPLDDTQGSFEFMGQRFYSVHTQFNFNCPSSCLGSLLAPTNQSLTLNVGQPRYLVRSQAPDSSTEKRFLSAFCISLTGATLLRSFVVTQDVPKLGSKRESQNHRPWSYLAGMLQYMLGFTFMSWAVAQGLSMPTSTDGKLISHQEGNLQPQAGYVTHSCFELAFCGFGIQMGVVFVISLLCISSEIPHVVQKDQTTSPWSKVGLHVNCVSARLKWVKCHRMKFRFSTGNDTCLYKSFCYQQRAWLQLKKRALAQLIPGPLSARLAHDKTWGDQTAIAALSQLLRKKVVVISLDHGKVYMFGRDEFSHTTYLFHQNNHFVQFTPDGHAWNSEEFKHTDFGGLVDSLGPLRGGGSDSSSGSSNEPQEQHPMQTHVSKPVKEETGQDPPVPASPMPDVKEGQASNSKKDEGPLIGYSQGFVLSPEQRDQWDLPEEMISPAVCSATGSKCEAIAPLSVIIDRASWRGQLYCPFCRVRNQNRWADKTFRKIGSWIQHCQMSRCMPYRLLNFYQAQYEAHKDKLQFLEHSFAADGWDKDEQFVAKPSDKPPGTVLPSDKAEVDASSSRKPAVPPTPPRARTRSPVAKLPDKASSSCPSRTADYVANESDTSMEGDIWPYFRIKVDPTLAKRKTITMPVLMTAPINGEQTNDARHGVLKVPIGLGVPDLYEMGFRVHEIVNSPSGPQYKRLSHENPQIFVARDKGRFLMVLRASCDIRLHISELTGWDEKALDRSCFPFCQVQDKLPLLSTRHEVNNPQRSCYNQLPVQEHILADSFFTATATFLQSRVVSYLLGLLCLVSFGGLGLDGEFLHFVIVFAKNASFVPDLHFGVLNTRSGVAETTPHWNLEAHVQDFKRVCISDALFSRESFDMLPMLERPLYDPRSYLQFVGFKGASQQTLLTGGAADITNKDIGMLTQRIKASQCWLCSSTDQNGSSL